MRRHIFLFGAATITCLLAMGAFNYCVDPFGEFGTSVMRGFNESKTEAFKYDRAARRGAIQRFEPDCLLVGSSRVAVGLPANDAALRGCARPYNAGLAGATMQEVDQLLAFASVRQPPRVVVLSLDLFMFNATRIPQSTDFDGGTSATGNMLHLVRQAFSTSTLAAAFDTVRHQSAEAPFEADGDVRDGFFGATLEYMGNHHALFLRGLEGYIYHNLPAPNYRFAYRDSGRDNLESLRRIVARRYAEGGTTVIMFSPAHAWQWQLLQTIGLGESWRDFKRQTVAIVEAEAARNGGAPFAIYDFAVPGILQSEPVPALADSAARVPDYWDGSHFRKSIGTIALRAMLTDDSAALAVIGERIDGATIEAHLAAVNRAAALWRESNPDVVEEIDSLVRCYATATLARRLQLPSADATRCRDFRLITR